MAEKITISFDDIQKQAANDEIAIDETKAFLSYNTASGDPAIFHARKNDGEIKITFTKIKRQTS
jgi:hypothetical protein